MPSHTTRLRQLLNDPEILITPGAYDGTGARLVAAAGFDAVYVGGFEGSATLLAQPDVGYLTGSQTATRIAAIAEALPGMPIVADGDTGYGNPLNVRATVRSYERAGAAAIHIEDQTSPKRCGHMLGREVIPAQDMVAKIVAAVEAREDPDFVVIARTDARTEHGIDEAIARGRVYAAAGADVLFIESPETLEEMHTICDTFHGKVPLLSNQVEGGRTPMPGTAALQQMGYSMALFPVGTAFAAAKGARDYLEVLKRTGNTDQARDGMLGFDEFNKLIGLDEHVRLERRYQTRPLTQSQDG